VVLTSPLCNDLSDVIDWPALGSLSEPLEGPLEVIKKVRGKFHKADKEKGREEKHQSRLFITVGSSSGKGKGKR
jgi:hypothetical protein